MLLTGHSHQAWPDVAFEGQERAWLDAASLVDDKWDAAAEQALRVRTHWKLLLNDREGDIALGQNTHELVTRLLSALPLRERPRLVTTDGEFHTIRRQLDRLAEEHLEIVTIPARPVDVLAERVADTVNDRTACVLVSSVLFETAEIVPGLDRMAAACTRHGATLIVDAYHHINAVPFDVDALGLGQAFVTGGGYKYCQLGEGNAFLRVPERCKLRPVLTGWFAEFAGLPASHGAGARVSYAEGAQRFAGATYDPTAHYRAAAVQAFHRGHELMPPLLRNVSRHQTGLLARLVENADMAPSIAHIDVVDPDRRAGFLAIRTAHAAAVVRGLRARDVLCDNRGDIVRLGPAPYVTDGQLRDAAQAFREVVRSVSTLKGPAPRAAR